MQFYLQAAGALLAGTGGAFGAYYALQARALHAQRQRFLLNSGAAQPLDAFDVQLEVTGLARRVLAFAVMRSKALGSGVNGRKFSSTFEQLAMHAGLLDALHPAGVADARLRLAIAGAAIGFVLGLMLSTLLAVLLGAVGALVGVFAIRLSLKQEAQARANAVERELSQMLEVLVLGLQGGLSFDGAFVLYQRYFTGSLARSSAFAYGQWSHGLVSRQDALKAMASSYDSPLLARVVESINRSLRFGTSLSETLSALAKECRAVRKAKLEELIAKAPVKMLVPVGTLILPAMLVLVMGPVVLDLMEGF